jgi:LuxR family maltose regulon positive regulatory protein
LERADIALTERHLGEDTSALKAEWLVMRSLMLNMEGKVAESQALAEQALEIAPASDGRVLSLVHFGLASVYKSLGASDQAMDAYQVAIQHGRSAGNLVIEMMSTSGLAQLAFEHGQLHLAFEIAAPVIDRAEETGSLSPINTVVFGILGEVLYQWHQIEQARYYAQRALHLSKLGGYRSGRIGCRVLLSRLSQLEGNLEAAAREIRSAFDLIEVDTPSYAQQEAVSQQVRLALAQNRLHIAQMALQGEGFSFRDPTSFPDIPSDQSIPYSTGLLYNSGLRVLLHQARSRRDLTGLRSDIAFADRLIESAFHGQYLPVALEGLLLRAQMHALLGDRQASQADLVRTLELVEPEGFIGVFVEQGTAVAESLADLIRRKQWGTAQRGYVERILAAFQRPDAVRDEPPATLIEPLTDRELDVLRLIAQGLKYKEIAERLVISLNTVRYHVKAIYGKLGVNNRTQAVEAARDLRLLTGKQ